MLDALTPEPGAFYLMDRGYMDFGRLHALHEAGSFFLIRAKRGLSFKRRYSHPVDRINTTVLCDQTVTLEVYYSKPEPDHVRDNPHKSSTYATTLGASGRSTTRSPMTDDGTLLCGHKE